MEAKWKEKAGSSTPLEAAAGPHRYDGAFAEALDYVRCQVACQVEQVQAVVQTLAVVPPAWPCPA